jgi:hypothetical protein
MSQNEVLSPSLMRCINESSVETLKNRKASKKDGEEETIFPEKFRS